MGTDEPTVLNIAVVPVLISKDLLITSYADC